MNYEKTKKDSDKLAKELYSEGIILRYMSLTFKVYIPLLIFWAIIVVGNDLFDLNQSSFSFNFVILIPPMILPIMIEYFIRLRRRREGFNINDNIQELVQQREVDIKVAREHKAIEKIVASKDVDKINKNDIEYWFGLKEKGIITEDEFNKKKGELL